MSRIDESLFIIYTNTDVASDLNSNKLTDMVKKNSDDVWICAAV